MTEPTCDEVCEAAPEFALDILEPAACAVFSAHLLRCPACRKEVEAMSAVGTRLLELIPGTEPPLGFDRRVLARVRPVEDEVSWPVRTARGGRRLARRHPRVLSGVAAAAAAVALLFGSLGWFVGRTSDPDHNQVVLTADFHQGSRTVGDVYAYRGSPAWLNMTLHGVTGVRRVMCVLVDKNGSTTVLGSFDLVSGSGSWGAPDRAGLAGLSGARLLGPNGQVIASATFL